MRKENCPDSVRDPSPRVVLHFLLQCETLECKHHLRVTQSSSFQLFGHTERHVGS